MLETQGFVVLVVLLAFSIFVLFAFETAIEVILLRKKGWLDRKRALWIPIGSNGLISVLLLVFSIVFVPIFLMTASLLFGYLIWSAQRGETEVGILGAGAVAILIWFGIPLFLIAVIRFLGFGLFKGRDAALTWKYNVIPIIVLETAYIISQLVSAAVVIAISPMFLPPV